MQVISEGNKMKNDKENDHPEIKNIKNICDISSDTKQTKKVCDILNKDKKKANKIQEKEQNK